MMRCSDHPAQRSRHRSKLPYLRSGAPASPRKLRRRQDKPAFGVGVRISMSTVRSCTTSPRTRSLSVGIFSTAATIPITGTEGLSSAIARIVPKRSLRRTCRTSSRPDAFGRFDRNAAVSKVIPCDQREEFSFFPVLLAGVYRMTISFAGCQSAGNSSASPCPFFHLASSRTSHLRPVPSTSAVRGRPSRSGSEY